MKGNGEMTGSSSPGLIQTEDVFNAWALYYSKFIIAYQHEGIDFWGLTVQNEPEFAAPWEACVYNPQQEADFVKNYLGPSIKKQFPDLKIMIYDHNKDHIQNWASTIYSDLEAAKYVDGTAFHWYSGPQFENVEATHNMFPGTNDHILV
jgi:glucosylceramidase